MTATPPISIRERRIIKWNDAAQLLGQQVFLDCLAANWIRPCAEKEGLRRNLRVYAMRDVEECERRMEEGEYPQPPENGTPPGEEREPEEAMEWGDVPLP